MGVTASDSRLLLDHFADSLVYSILRRQLRERLACNADVTFLQLREQAIRWEDDRRDEDSTASRHVAAQSDTAPMKELKQLREQVEKLTALVNMRQSSPRQATRAFIICFCCGQQGHIARHCSSRQQQQRKKPRPRTEARDLCLRLTAANGLELPYTGYLVATITIAGQVIPARVFLVIKDPPRGTKQPCLLGMNVLKEITSWEGLGRAPGPDLVAQKLTIGDQGGKYARLAEDVNLPPLSVTTVLATGCSPAFVGDLVVEPMEYPTKTIMAIPCVIEARSGRFSMSLLNAGEEGIVLRRRTVVGILGDAEIVPPNIDLQVTSCGIEVYASSSRLQVPQEPVKAPLIEDMMPNDLPHEEKTALHSFLMKNLDMFSWTPLDLGYTNAVKHKIPVLSDTPIAQAYRRIPPSQFEDVRQHIQELANKGIIKPSSSPYASPIVVVRKKDGSIRLCIDYRKLNAITRKDAFPLPRIDESFDSLCGAKYFSTLDLASGYHQVAMEETDQEKTAFTTPFGLYEFTRMPFGLSGAPATFQRLMQSSMNDLVLRIILVYQDDVLVFSSDFDDHIKRLETVFNRVRELGLKLNPEKCQRSPLPGAYHF
ncbi:Pol polyprotein [Plakobranchus ocellatus]|uniref:Pol polyprotein n=1 Tax=Plakobranchus ocellatus TaxID=259542 RepID=A0AAV3ZIB6_9GAST|nr:Pol polyprotein [Plakobranchus ocellatus]